MSYLKRLLNYSRRFHKLNLLGLGLALAAIVLGLIKPYLTKMIVDEVLVEGDYELFTTLALVFLGMTFLRVIAQYFKSYIFQHTSQGVLYDLRSDLFRRLLKQSFAFYDRERTGLLMNRLVGDLRAVRMFLNVGYVQAFEATFYSLVHSHLHAEVTCSFDPFAPFNAALPLYDYKKHVAAATPCFPFYPHFVRKPKLLCTREHYRDSGCEVVGA